MIKLLYLSLIFFDFYLLIGIITSKLIQLLKSFLLSKVHISRIILILVIRCNQLVDLSLKAFFWKRIKLIYHHFHLAAVRIIGVYLNVFPERFQMFSEVVSGYVFSFFGNLFNNFSFNCLLFLTSLTFFLKYT